MAWRFKASKYKNAAPIVPKPEACIRDISVGSYQTYGNNIAASAAFMAFNVDHNGSNLAVLPLEDYGRKSKTMPLLHAHADTVTDIDFSPFHDGLLATGSQDCLVKLWHIPETGLEEPLINPECTFSHRQRRVEVVCWHPSAEHLLTTVSYTNLSLWDVISQQELFSNNEHADVIQSLSWKQDGVLLATSCKDKQVRIIDPRASSCIVDSCSSHQSIKDSRIVWLNNDRILTTGFDSARLRQIYIRDLRHLNEPVKTLELDCSTGILMPLFDPDTNMLFLAGKGDTTIMYMEVMDRDPFLVEGIRHSGEQTKGVCLVPKRALNVMQAEVNRLLQLTSNMVIPIMYQVPRKTYRDFHADIYPDTVGCVAQNNAAAWIKGHNVPVPKISLDPAKRSKGEEVIAPRLGPKPFQAKSGNQEFSFDKIFSVPVAPNSDTNGYQNDATINQTENNTEPQKSPSFINEHIKETENGKSDSSSLEEETNSSDSGYKPKTPSTAERRKVFEIKGKDESPESEDLGNFERGGANRNSIAERRKLYESRSVSVTDGNLAEKAMGSPTMLRRRDSFKTKSDVIKEDEVKKVISMIRQQSMDPRLEKVDNSVPNPMPKRISTVFGRVSKFRHLKGTPGHKSTHIENIRNISRQISGECDGFHVNPDRAAVPLSGPGGKIAVLELKKTGRLPDGVMPALVNGASIMDFQWDPFNNQRLAVACDDGMIRLWEIPESGLAEPTNEPKHNIKAHMDKIYLIKFHPLASDVLASASYDMIVKIWDLSLLSSCEPIAVAKITLMGHTDQIFSLAWSPCGQYLASACKDGKLRVYKPRSSDVPIKTGKGPVGTRGARVVWASKGQFLVVMGFDKVSERQIYVFKLDNLNTPLTTVGLDVSPAILMPHYDEDSSTLFLTGRGDSTIYAFEVTEEPPYCCPLSHHRCSSLHQGLSFLPKNKCDVASVEFASALRLTNNTIEPLSFTVPRIKSELFQDDLFPPTKVTWKPTMTASEWFNGANKQTSRLSLKPPGMDNLTESQGQGAVTVSNAAKQQSTQSSTIQPPFSKFGWNFDVRAKQEEMQRTMSSLVGDVIPLTLEQDQMEGVEEHEWDE